MPEHPPKPPFGKKDISRLKKLAGQLENALNEIKSAINEIEKE